MQKQITCNNKGANYVNYDVTGSLAAANMTAL